MKAAKEERHRQEAVERGKRQQRRQARSRLQKVNAEVTTIRADEGTKLATVVMLRERLQGVEELNEHAPGVRDERLALVEAIDMATEKGAPVVSGVTCLSRPTRSGCCLTQLPHGTNWRLPLVELAWRRQALTQERDRLRARLQKLEDGDTGGVCA